MAAFERILTVKEAVLSRRSIRRFKPNPVPEHHLREILSLALLAPSSNNLQPWRVVVVREQELKERLRAVAHNQAQVSSAPAVLVIYSDMKDALARVEETLHPGFSEEQKQLRATNLRRAWEHKTDEEREEWGKSQGFILLGFLMLLARAFGYDTVPMGGFDEEGVKAVLELPAHVKITALLPIGVADENGYQHHRHSLERVVQWR
ncbi:nitroreductase family protein [Meiothermus sp. QL-1]|uniref:nitroreductase family protein n=1 Tax=Meiothermus sp. QL-1 TaxID=2058095 RepID=UPI000E0C9CD3|nr:nitroreductase family protein [Meiothermus sp. QL-1]RDI94759.1 nitroreductase family protein [Meiothermus sp. QL-1]